MNCIVLHGRLTQEPETKFYNDNKAVCRFSIAVDRGKDKDGNRQADFFNCVAFGKTGEVIDKFFKKGDGISVQGEMQNNRYNDKDGNKRDGWQVVVRSFDWDYSRKKQADEKEAGGSSEEFYPIEGGSTEDDDLPF